MCNISRDVITDAKELIKMNHVLNKPDKINIFCIKEDDKEPIIYTFPHDVLLTSIKNQMELINNNQYPSIDSMVSSLEEITTNFCSVYSTYKELYGGTNHPYYMYSMMGSMMDMLNLYKKTKELLIDSESIDTYTDKIDKIEDKLREVNVIM